MKLFQSETSKDIEVEKAFDIFHKTKKKPNFLYHLGWALGIAYCIFAFCAATSPYFATSDLIELTSFVLAFLYGSRSIFKFRQYKKNWFKSMANNYLKHSMAYAVLCISFIGLGNLVSPSTEMPAQIVHHVSTPISIQTSPVLTHIDNHTIDYPQTR